MMIAALLICCSLLRIPSLTPLVCGENLTRPGRTVKIKSGEAGLICACLGIRQDLSSYGVGSNVLEL